MRRREFLGVLGGTAAIVSSGAVQSQGRPRRVGFLGTATSSGYASLVKNFRSGLARLGWQEGRDISIEYRWADGNYDLLPALASELAGLHVDVLVTHGTPGTQALQRATREIPIVMTVSADAVGTGLVKSLARPGGNTTGQSFLAPAISAKRLELLKEALPSLARVATVYNVGNPAAELDLRVLAETARAKSIELRPFEVRGPEDFDQVFSGIAAGGFQAVSIIHDSILTANVKRLADLALRYRPPLARGPTSELAVLLGMGRTFTNYGAARRLTLIRFSEVCALVICLFNYQQNLSSC